MNQPTVPATSHHEAPLLAPETQLKQAQLMQLVINGASVTTMAMATALLISQDNLRPLLPYLLTLEIVALTVLNIVFSKRVDTLKKAVTVQRHQPHHQPTQMN